MLPDHTSRFPSHKPIVYLAGKIKPHDWREHLIGPDVSIDAGPGAKWKLFDPCYLIELPTFVYGGPFYVSCDHCCAHGAANHGVGASGDEAGCMTEWWGDKFDTPRRVFEVNRRRIMGANAVFAFIDQPDCHGTLIELGMATELGKRIAVVFDKSLSAAAVKDLWMARLTANAGLYVRWSLDTAWQTFLQTLADPHGAAARGNVAQLRRQP
jgi:nucleoside 2-deoxyribosyltransferase